jgi:hypothetical protein
VRFVTVKHPKLGTTSVPESRVPHLSDGWSVVEPASPAPPVKRASRARKPRKES